MLLRFCEAITLVKNLYEKTKEQLNIEKKMLQDELDGINKKLDEWQKMVNDLNNDKYEIERRIGVIERLFQEYKDDGKKARW